MISKWVESEGGEWIYLSLWVNIQY
jgi:hypothetical protein